MWSKNQSALYSLQTIFAQFVFLFLQLQFSYGTEDYVRIKRAFLIQNIFLLLLCFRYGRYYDSRFWLQSSLSGADPNYLSGWFIIPLCFATEELFDDKTKKWIKPILIAQIVLSFYYIMQTASKSGLITNGLAIMLVTMYRLREELKTAPLKCVGIIVVFGCGVLLALNRMPEYLLRRLSDSDMTMSGRTTMWMRLLSIIANNPLGLIFGFGTSSVALYTSTGMVSHNTFIDVFFNQGIIGIATVLFFIFRGIKDKFRRFPALIIIIASMSILMCTLSALSTRFVMFMFFLTGMEITDTDINRQ